MLWTMDINDRIAQWEKMTREAPDDMAWFSLGNTYMQADRVADAQAAMAQAIQLNPTMSRAYEERGRALIQLGQVDEAAAVLEEGYRVAAGRGDLMPQKAMALLLEQLGRALPKAQTPMPDLVQPQATANTIVDRRTGQPGTRMVEAPMRGPLGAFIRDHYSQETWRQWIAQGTKVINELRLDFSNQEHQKIYDQYMKEWLQISDADLEPE